jgi:ABC-2 type transport system permease protein
MTAARRTRAIAGHQLRMIRRQAGILVIFTVSPLLILAMTRPLQDLALAHQGFPRSGIQQGAGGGAVLFAASWAIVTGQSFHNEHLGGTWERLRASAARPTEIIAGKVAPLIAVALAQQALVFVAGLALFGMRLRGSVPALGLMAVLVSVVWIALGVTFFTVARTGQQISILAILPPLLAIMSGTLIPVSVFPGWMQVLAKGLPAYWGVRGYRTILVEGGGLGDLLLPAGVLTAFIVGLTALSVLRFRMEETRELLI